MNETQYALIGVLLGAAIPALASIWQGRQAGALAERDRQAAAAERQNDHRLALIASWREGLASVLAETGTHMAGTQNPLYTQPWYLSLRPHLSDEARKRAEPRSRTIVISDGAPVLFSLTDEIARIERDWNLT